MVWGSRELDPREPTGAQSAEGKIEGSDFSVSLASPVGHLTHSWDSQPQGPGPEMWKFEGGFGEGTLSALPSPPHPQPTYVKML